MADCVRSIFIDISRYLLDDDDGDGDNGGDSSFALQQTYGVEPD